jgi:hypothetical protein
MRESGKKKRIPRERELPSVKGRESAEKKEPARPLQEQLHDSEAIERAVYDGMQDLRAYRTK